MSNQIFITLLSLIRIVLSSLIRIALSKLTSHQTAELTLTLVSHQVTDSIPMEIIRAMTMWSPKEDFTETKSTTQKVIRSTKCPTTLHTLILMVTSTKRAQIVNLRK
jgi:uncharacterized membrane protein